MSFHSNTESTKKDENITIEIKDSTVMFPDDSSELFSFYKNKIEINQDIDTSNVKNMHYMFFGAINANPNVSKWNTSNVTDMSGMFEAATNANPNVSNWNTSNVIDMSYMFHVAINAKPNVSKWDTSSVTDMSVMFYGALNADPNVSNWNTSRVINMGSMFAGAIIANPNVSNWDTSKVTNMETMFFGATNANPDMSKWNLENLVNSTNILNGTKTSVDDPRFENIKTPEQLKQLLKDIGAKKINKLKEAKKLEIDNLADLNKAQKDALKSEIDNTNNNQTVNVIVTKAIELNTEMHKLNEQITKLTANASPKLESLKDEVNIEKLKNLSKDKVIALTKKIKDELDSIKTLDELKEAKKLEIDNLADLNKAQKDALKSEIYNANNDKIISDIVKKATELNESMSKLKEEMKKIEANNSPKLKVLKDEVNVKKETNLNKQEVDDLIKQIKDKLASIDSDSIKKIELKNYKPLADAFYYTDTSIADRIDEKAFLDVNFSKSVVDVLNDVVNNKFDSANIIAGVQVGANSNITKDLVIGGFAEYQNKVSHNASVGMSLKYKDILTFIRYRIALKAKKINHNVDLYARYSKQFTFNKFELTPKIGLYLTYSHKVKLAENVELRPRVGVIGDTALLMAYNINRAKIYVEPKLSFGYNDQKIAQTNLSSNEYIIKRGYVDYALRLGAKYKFINNVTLDGDINVKGDMNKNIKVGTRLGVAYNW
ncbi:BspA family leucine-rich repeat surface protein [Oceanivirga salmonicida]|uniref:BspA family leucine-rich repeat surface protein n=1 Tax=Oceanivirga salmonicida TaxID=1769291 RepID=UPI0012E221FB|nr:BspA family leucine-rich repeat surface protein [Oceanivirga salmonicida]